MKRKRRIHTAEFKARVALEAARGVRTVNEIAADNELHTQLVRAGLEPWERNPAQLRQVVEQDWQRWAGVVKAAGIQTG